jgi:hypothetical protein
MTEIKRDYRTMTSKTFDDESTDGVFAQTFDELADGVFAVRRQLTEIHESVKQKHDLASAFDDAVITFG